jgi:hypothetical protein
MNPYKVSDYRKNCPTGWADDQYFVALHDTEAMWILFSPFAASPQAVLVGSGGINALTGKKLGTVLEKDNYLVCPPQPWLDGWKDKDGTVFQFVATPHKKGKRITVAEQLIGEESQTGAIGLSIFDPKEPGKLTHVDRPQEGWTEGATTQDWGYSMNSAPVLFAGLPLTKSMRSARPVDEMGLGKGGKIIQKIYPDPYGLEVWKEKPTAVFVMYLVDAKTAEEITGETVQDPVTHDKYKGKWYGLKDQTYQDVPGTDQFTGLQSVAFPGDKSNMGSGDPEYSDDV